MPRTLSSKFDFIADEQDAEQRHAKQDDEQRDRDHDQPRLAESADQIGRGKLQRDERYTGRRVGQHASRSDDEQGVTESRHLVVTGDEPSRAANVNRMLSEKLITMISGVITLRNMLS